MKKVEFQGAEFEVPDWAKYIGQDADGSVWAHESKPTDTDGFWHAGGKCIPLISVNAPVLLKEIK